MIKNGDIVLVLKVGGWNLTSALLAWWQNSDVASHVGIITDAKNLQIYDARIFQKSKIINIDKFFDGNHMLHILRYDPELTEEQSKNVVDFLYANVGVKYDNASILSIIANHDFEKGDRLNCAESTLLAYNCAELLTKRDINYILPHTFWEFYMADRFTLVNTLYKPKKDDIKELLNV